MERIESVLLPALDNVKTEGVVWGSVVKLVKYVSDSQRIEKELQYSLKRRMKSRDSAKILNTLTVYHTISLNCSLLVRQQLSEKKSLQVFGKVFFRSRDSIIQHAILQLLMDWSFLFSKEALGDRSEQLLQKLALRKGKLPRPTMMVVKLQRGGGVLGTVSRSFVRGFEFEYRTDQVVLEEDGNYKVSHSCRPTMHCRNFKFRAVKRIFCRANSRLLASSTRSPIVLELSTRPPQMEANIEDLSLMVPSDCKQLQDLLSGIQILMTKNHWTEVEAMLYLAESLRGKCLDWKRKIVENVALRLHNEDAVLDEEDDELRPMLFAKLLSLGEMLQTVLTNFEHIQNKCAVHFEDKHSEKQSEEEEVDENDDALSFVSARSASSSSSINFDSNGDLNWRIFSSEKDGSMEKHTCSGFAAFCVETESETEDNKPTIKSVPKPPSIAHSVTSPNKPGNDESAFPMSYSYTFGDLTSNVPRPSSVISGGDTADSAAASVLVFDDNETPFCIPPHRTSNVHSCEQKPSPFTFLSLDKRSRSFSELKSVRDQDLTSKDINITYPPSKVRLSDNHLRGGLSQKRRALKYLD